MKRTLGSFISVIAFLIIAFTSCDRVVQIREDLKGPVAVNLQAGIKPPSTYVANDQWETTDEVGLYMKKAGQTITAEDAIYSDASNVKMSIVGQTLTSDPQIMYPTSGNVDFVAYYPYADVISSDFVIPVNVAGQDAGLPVELLYSNNITNQTPTELPVTLNFNYSLAKIELTVSDGANSALTATDYADATASIEGMFTQANFILDDGTFTDFQVKQPVTLYKKSVTATSATFEALILPTNEEITFLFDVGGVVYQHTMTVNYLSENLYKYNFALDFPNLPPVTATLLNAVIIPRNETPQQNISIDTEDFMTVGNIGPRANATDDPLDAIYVDPNGNDNSATGAKAFPFQSINTALAAASTGATIVLRGGTYQEGRDVRVRKSDITIKSAKGEWAVIDLTTYNSGHDQDSGIEFYPENEITGGHVTGCKLQHLEIKGGFYAVSFETKWEWGQVDRSGVSDIIVEDCILHDSRNDVVKVKPGCKNITIRYNKIYNSGREYASKTDFNTGEYNAEGIDNVNGDNMHVHHNYIYDICSTGIYAKDGATDVIIENNRIERTYAGGIMVGFDTSPQYFDITVNPKFYENINGIVRNNLIIDAGWEGINNRIVEIRYVNAGDVYPTRDIPSLDGNPTMNDNCYFVAGKSATFTDNRPTAVEDMDLSAWKSHISGDSGTIEVNPALDAKYMPTNPQCVDMGIQTPLTFI